MPDFFNLPFDGLFSNLSDQGNVFNGPISPSNRYYAFLSKVDLDETTQLYDVFFELMPKEWADNAFFAGEVNIKAQAPTPPATCYHFPRVPGNEIAARLGLKSPDDMAEGSWYEILIEKKTSEEDNVVGFFYDPSLDFEASAPPSPF